MVSFPNVSFPIYRFIYQQEREFCSHFGNSSPPPTTNILNSVHILKFAQDKVPGNKLTYYVRCEQGKQHKKGPVFTRKGYLLRFYRGSRPWLQLLIKRFDLLVIQSECYFRHQFFLPRAYSYIQNVHLHTFLVVWYKPSPTPLNGRKILL